MNYLHMFIGYLYESGRTDAYSHSNFFHAQVNIQKEPEESLAELNYDLADLSCWEHLLAGEPFFRRQLVGIDTTDKRTAVDTEKHLDMPFSWVEKLDITGDGKQITTMLFVICRNQLIILHP